MQNLRCSYSFRSNDIFTFTAGKIQVKVDGITPNALVCCSLCQITSNPLVLLQIVKTATVQGLWNDEHSNGIKGSVLR